MKREIKLNPMKEIRLIGVTACQQRLEELEVQDLRDIVNELSFDTFKMLTKKQKQDKQYLVEYIMKRTKYFTTLGWCFNPNVKNADELLMP